MGAWIQVVLKLIENPAEAMPLIQGISAIVSSVEAIIKAIESLTQQPQTAPILTAIANRIAPK